MSGAHVHGDKETIQRLVAIVMERMKRGDGRRATEKERVIPSRQARDRDPAGRGVSLSLGTIAIPRCARDDPRRRNSSSAQLAALATFPNNGLSD